MAFWLCPTSMRMFDSSRATLHRTASPASHQSWSVLLHRFGQLCCLATGSLDLIDQKPKLVGEPLPACGYEPTTQFAIHVELYPWADAARVTPLPRWCRLFNR